MPKKIMVVDDEQDLINLILRLLSPEGYDVVVARNGKECLEKLDEGLMPDLILMDFFMPEMSGRQTADWIRKNPKTKKAKIVFLTLARFRKKGMENLKALGVSDYITKPFDETKFVERIREVLRE